MTTTSATTTKTTVSRIECVKDEFIQKKAHKIRLHVLTYDSDRVYRQLNTERRTHCERKRSQAASTLYWAFGANDWCTRLGDMFVGDAEIVQNFDMFCEPIPVSISLSLPILAHFYPTSPIRLASRHHKLLSYIFVCFWSYHTSLHTLLKYSNIIHRRCVFVSLPRALLPRRAHTCTRIINELCNTYLISCFMCKSDANLIWRRNENKKCPEHFRVNQRRTGLCLCWRCCCCSCHRWLESWSEVR